MIVDQTPAAEPWLQVRDVTKRFGDHLNYALYPNLSAHDNIAAPLVMRELPGRDRLPLIGRHLPGARGRVLVAGEQVAMHDAIRPGAEGTLGFRPEHGRLSAGQLPGTLAVRVERTEHAGSEAHVFLRVHATNEPCVVRIASSELGSWPMSADGWLGVDADLAWFFPRAGTDAFAVRDEAAKPASPRLLVQRRAGAVLAAPAAILLIGILLLPSSAVLVLSFTDYSLGDGSPVFVGLDSYMAILTDPVFRSSARNTAVFVGVVAPASVGFGLLFALMIDRRSTLKRWYRTAFFLPVTATFVAMATAWEVLLHPTFGLFNTLLSLAGLEKIRFLSDPGIALFALAAIGIWKQVGYDMILFLAGIATIAPELYEAASLDGADRGWRRFLLVTWPALRPVTLFVVVITMIRALSEFETVAVLTGGGPVHSTGVVLFELYEEAFRFLKIGTGSALAVLFLAFVAALSLIQIAVSDRRSPHA
eukprot:gene1324-1341_t